MHSKTEAVILLPVCVSPRVHACIFFTCRVFHMRMLTTHTQALSHLINILQDVGFGKTEVALDAIFRCVSDGRQAVFLAPTTVLAAQHYRTCEARFQKYGIRLVYLLCDSFQWIAWLVFADSLASFKSTEIRPVCVWVCDPCNEWLDVVSFMCWGGATCPQNVRAFAPPARATAYKQCLLVYVH